MNSNELRQGLEMFFTGEDSEAIIAELVERPISFILEELIRPSGNIRLEKIIEADSLDELRVLAAGELAKINFYERLRLIDREQKKEKLRKRR